MKRHLLLLLGALAILLLPGTHALASFSEYSFSVEEGFRNDMSSSTSLWAGQDGTGGTANQVRNFSIGFDFLFDGTMYDQISVSTNGVIGFGDVDITTSNANNLANVNVPAAAPFWDQHRVSGGAQGCFRPKIHYKLDGTAPNRVLTVEWQEIELVRVDGYPNWGTWQARLYEGSNRLEFWFGSMSPCDACFGSGECFNTSASIGLSSGSSNFLSVVPDGSGGANTSSTTATNNVNILDNYIPENTVYAFQPCNIGVKGDESQGGTADMNNGDDILTGMQVQRGSSGEYYPFTVHFSSPGCNTRDYSIEITGPNAADYQIDPNSGTLYVDEWVTPMITFTPSGVGVRRATLTVRDDNGFVRSYDLRAEGLPRIQWISDVPQGGTTNLNSGDTLLQGKIVQRRTIQSFMPLTLLNFNDNPGASAADITFTIDDPTGQFSIDPAGTSLGSGESVTPSITFAPMGVGIQEARLTVNADGETRTFLLRAFAKAPGGIFLVNSVQLGPNQGLFANLFTCVGVQSTTQEIVVRNTGSDNFLIEDIDFYQLDPTYRQGTADYPLVRDAAGRPMPSYDYIITTAPVRAPISPGMAPSFPVVIPEGQSRTLYITYVGQRPEKRYARVFVRTNGQNFLGTDTTYYDETIPATRVEGLLTFDLFGRAIGGRLSGLNGIDLQKGITFPTVALRDSVEQTITISNPGDCELRINAKHLRITTGDVNEFKIVSVLPNTTYDFTSNDYVLAPGTSDQIVIRFKPTRSGSRLATLWMQTNDSTIQSPGLTERGAYYIDLYGRGRAFLETKEDLVLDPVVIGGSSTGSVTFENTSNFGIEISRILFEGQQASEFAENDADAWPTLPLMVLPGMQLKISVKLTPTGGAGTRRTTLKLVTTTGDTIIAYVRGEAGVQSLSVSPLALFGSTSIAVGQEVREKVTITNSGSLPLTLQSPTLSGADAANYRMSTLPRLTLNPGQTEYLEVTYAPQSAGASSAQIDIMSNASATPVVVTLGGEAAKMHGGGIDPTETVVRPGGGRDAQIEEARPVPGGLELTQRTSGVDDATAMNGELKLMASRPNPARETAALAYRLNDTKAVDLALYDASGALMKVLDRGARAAGEHVVMVDVSGLASGTYYYRLQVDGVTLTRTLTVVR